MKTYVRNVTEARSVRLFTDSYGTDLRSRYEKFKEEVSELMYEVEVYLLATEKMVNNHPEVMNETVLRIKDEGSDVQGTFTHLMSLFGIYQQEMLDNCVDKVKGRKTDPNYRR